MKINKFLLIFFVFINSNICVAMGMDFGYQQPQLLNLSHALDNIKIPALKLFKFKNKLKSNHTVYEISQNQYFLQYVPELNTAMAIIKSPSLKELTPLTIEQAAQASQLLKAYKVERVDDHWVVMFNYSDVKVLPKNRDEALFLLLSPHLKNIPRIKREVRNRLTSRQNNSLKEIKIDKIEHSNQQSAFIEEKKELKQIHIISWSQKSISFIKQFGFNQNILNFQSTNQQDLTTFNGIVSNINHYCETITTLPTAHEKILVAVTTLNLFNVLEQAVHFNEKDITNTIINLTNKLDSNPVKSEEVQDFLSSCGIQIQKQSIDHVISKINIVSHAITDLTIGAFTRSIKEQTFHLYLWNDTISGVLEPNDPLFETCTKEIPHIDQEPIQKISIIVGYAFVGGHFDKNNFDFKADSIKNCAAQYRRNEIVHGQPISASTSLQSTIQKNPQAQTTDYSSQSHTSVKINEQTQQVIIHLVGSESYNVHFSPELGMQFLEDLRKKHPEMDLPQYRYTISKQTSETSISHVHAHASPQSNNVSSPQSGNNSSIATSTLCKTDKNLGAGIDIAFGTNQRVSFKDVTPFVNTNCLLALPGIFKGILKWCTGNYLYINNILMSDIEIYKILPSDVEVKNLYIKQTHDFFKCIIHELKQAIASGTTLDLSKYKKPYDLDPMHQLPVEARQFDSTFKDQKFNDFVNEIVNATIEILEQEFNYKHTCTNEILCKINKAGTILGKVSYYLDPDSYHHVLHGQILDECKMSHPHMYNALRQSTWSAPRKGFEYVKEGAVNTFSKLFSNKVSVEPVASIISKNTQAQSQVTTTTTHGEMNQSVQKGAVLQETQYSLVNRISTELHPKTLEMIVQDLGYDPAIIKPIDDSAQGMQIHEALFKVMNKASEMVQTSQNEWYRLLGIQTLDAAAEQYKVLDSLKGNTVTALGNTKQFVQRAFEKYSQLSDPREFFGAAFKNTWLIGHQIVDLTINQLFRSPEDRALYWKEFCSRAGGYLDQLAHADRNDFVNCAADLVGMTVAALDNAGLAKGAIGATKLVSKGLKAVVTETTKHGLKKGLKNNAQYLKEVAKQTLQKVRDETARRMAPHTVDPCHARSVKTPQSKSKSESKKDSKTEPPAAQQTYLSTKQNQSPEKNAHSMQTRSKAKAQQNNATENSTQIKNLKACKNKKIKYVDRYQNLSNEVADLEAKWRKLKLPKGYGPLQGKKIIPIFKHFLSPDMTRFGNATGWHHDPCGFFEKLQLYKGKKIEIVTRRIKRQLGCYEFKWQYKGSTRKEPKISTFFPKKWSRETITEKVAEAWMDCVDKKAKFKITDKGNYKVIGKTEEGLRIEIVLNKLGEIITAYPYFGE